MEKLNGVLGWEKGAINIGALVLKVRFSEISTSLSFLR